MKLRTFQLAIFLRYSFLLIHFCLGQAVPSQNASSSEDSSAGPVPGGNRPVYLIMSIRMTAAQIFPPAYDKLFPAYAALHFNATATDGPLDIQLVNKNGQDIIRLTDRGLQNRDRPMGIPQSGYLTDYFELFGKSNVTNDQILNSSSGKGLVHDVWAQNTSLSLKAYNSIDFMLACIGQLGLGLASSDNRSAIIPSRIAQAQTYWRNMWVADRVVSHYPVWLETLHGWGDQVQKSRTEFNFKAESDPSSGMVPSHHVTTDNEGINQDVSRMQNGISSLAPPETAETYMASNDSIASAPEYQWIYAQLANDNHDLAQRDLNSDGTIGKQFLVWHPGENDFAIGQELDTDGKHVQVARPIQESGSQAQRSLDVVAPANRANTAVSWRMLSLTSTNLARGGLFFGELAGVIAIIVLDFKNHEDSASTISGLFCAIMGFVGALSMFGLPGIGELIMLAAIIVGEIPNFIHSSQTPPNTKHDATNTRPAYRGGWKRMEYSGMSTPPLRTDVRGILQYTITGDKNMTGNEKCLEKGYKDCTVVYGPYLLASALQIEEFDAFALLIHYNEGYPMSMSDLVKAFILSTDPDSINQVASIDCSHSMKPNDRFSWSNPNTANILKQCDKPIFSIKRQLVNIPIINQTADQVHERLMPQGDCALVGDVTGGERYPALNLTVQGGAVAIACGIVGAINMNGTAISLPETIPSIDGSPGGNNQSMPSPSLFNPGNQSSDGSSGRAYIAPPPTAPFQTTLNLTNSACMSTSSGSKLCFPNGTYSSQSGDLGFDSPKANTLTLPANSSFVITESTKAKSKGVYAHAPAPIPSLSDHQVTYTTNQSATDTNFAKDMQNMNKFKSENTFTVYVATEPDAVCLYKQPRGGGDFACFGPGGGDLPDGLKGKVMSVRAYGRASAEIFATSYGNSFAHIFDTYEDDLSTLPFDEHSNFADKAYAIWVYLEPKPSA